MNALEKVLNLNPDMDAGRIIRYGCPDRYGIGSVPEWCPGVTGVETVKDGCPKCWNQEVSDE